LTIGAVSVNYNKKTFSTAPIQITVGSHAGAQSATAPQPGAGRNVGNPNAGAANSASNPGNQRNEPVFLTTTVDRKDVYVNEPIVLTLRLYTRIPILGQRNFQKPTAEGFWTEEISNQKDYVAVVNGAEYRVSELKSVLFPTTAGKLTINPASMAIQVQDVGRRTGDPFADEFMRGFFSGAKEVTVRSDPIHINAKPIPDQGRPSDFSGTVGQWSLSAKLDRQVAKVGEAVNLEIRIFGEGNVKSVGKVELPAFTGFRTYDTVTTTDVQKQDGRVRGAKTFRTLLRPEITGELTLPALMYSYFNPKTGKFEKVSVPGLHLKVVPGDPQTTMSALPAQSIPGTEGSAPGIKVMARDIRYLKTQVALTGVVKPWGQSFWVIGFSMPPLLIVGAWWWRRKQDRLEADPRYARKRSAGKSARNALRQAHQARMHKDAARFYSVLSQALVGYLADRLGFSRSGVTQREIFQRLIDLGADDARVTQLSGLLDECDFARFAPGESQVSAMEQHETLAEALLDDFSKVLEKEIRK
jgi:hypothetical protein